MRKYYSFGVVLLMVLFVFAGCSSSSSGDSLSPPTVNVSGTWYTTEYVNGTGCSEGYYYQYGTYIATQEEGSNTVSVYVSSLNKTYTGTVSGNVLSWSGSYPEDGGTTTVRFSLTVNETTEASFSGTASWSWTDGSSSCSGSTEVDGTKL